MGGHLERHPHLKSYDELQRTLKRTEKYIEVYDNFLDDSEIIKAKRIIEHVNKAISYIPNEYRLTIREYQKKKKER